MKKLILILAILSMVLLAACAPQPTTDTTSPTGNADIDAVGEEANEELNGDFASDPVDEAATGLDDLTW